MRIYLRSLLSLVFGAFVAAVIAPASILLFDHPQKAGTVLDAMMLTFLIALAGFALVHLPSFLAMRAIPRLRSARALPLLIGTVFCFIPVIMITLLFMSDGDNPQGLGHSLRQAFALDAETLPWFFGFAVGGIVFLEAFRRVLAPRHQGS